MRKIRKYLLILSAVLVLLIVAAPFVVPRLIDWNGFKPQIAEAAREATGRDLVIDGDIRLVLLPRLEFSASGIRFANTPGGSAPEMATIKEIVAEVQIWPLLGRELVVDRFVIREPSIFLEIGEDGRPNWEMKPTGAAAAETSAEPGAVGEEPPLDDIRLTDVSIEGGSLSFVNALSGQTVRATDLNVTVALPDLASALILKASLVLNDSPVAIEASVDAVRQVLTGAPFAAKASLKSAYVGADLDSTVRTRPAPGLDGTFALDVASVGKLAAWLGQPLAKGQPDPGPLKVKARFTTEGTKATLESATIEGEALRLQARGSVDQGEGMTRIAFDVESDVLDIDRYLPPPQAKTVEVAQADTGNGEDGAVDPLAALSDEPLDLSPLRRMDVDISMRIQGVRAAGFEIGSVAFTATVKNGVLAAQITELSLYGGNVKGRLDADGSGDALAVAADLAIDGVEVDKLARAATGGEAPVTGIASGTVKANARGASPQELAETLKGRVLFELGGVDVRDAPVGAISEVKLDLELPGLEAQPRLKASVVYNKKRVDIDVVLDPVRQILSADRFAARAVLESALIKARYEGNVQQRPVPGLDGTFGLDIPSVGKLAAWLDQPLDPAQPDPGPLKVNARFASDGPKVTLDEATIQGESLDLKANGSYDGGAEVAKVVLNLESGLLDIDRYLPPPAEGEAAEDAPAARPADPLAAIPSEPLDLGALRKTDADISVRIGGAKAMGFQIGTVAFKATSRGGVLEAEIGELALYGGMITGRLKLDGARDALAVDSELALDKVDLGKLASAATGGEAPLAAIASGTFNATARGSSARALVESLNAKLGLALDEVSLRDAPDMTIAGLTLDVALPGMEAPPAVKAALVLNGQDVTLDVQADPVTKVLAGDPFAVTTRLASALVTASIQGIVKQRPAPGMDGSLDLAVPSVGELAAWLGQPLDPAQPDPGRLGLKARFAAEGANVTVSDALIEGEGLKVEVNATVDGDGAVPKLVLDLRAGVLDLDRYLPPPAEAEAAAEAAAEAPPADLLAALPDEPLDLSGLAQAEADVTLTIEGIKAMGYEIGRTAAVARLKGGVLDLDLREINLYGGVVTGNLKLDGAGETPGLSTTVTLSGVAIDQLARAATGADAAAAGRLSALIEGRASGTSARALVEGLTATLAAELPEIALKDVPDAHIAKVSLAVDLPGMAGKPVLSAHAVYNDRPVKIDGTLDPLRKVLAGDPFAVRFGIEADLVTAKLDGTVQQRPVPGFSGDMALAVTSVGELAAWLGQPLDPAQPDPGPLKVRARFATDGPKVSLSEAVIEGEGLNVLAQGAFDGSGAVPKIELDVETGVIDLDRFLPKAPEEKRSEAPAEEGAAPSNPLAALSEEPLDLSGLKGIDADVSVRLGGLNAMGFKLGVTDLGATLAGGRLAVELKRLALYGGTVAAKLSLDGAAEVPALDAVLTLKGVDVGKLARDATGGEAPVDGTAGATLKARATGASPRALAENLHAKLAARLAKVVVKDALPRPIPEIALDLDLPGLSGKPTVKGRLSYNGKRIDLDVTTDPVITILGEDRFAVAVLIESPLLAARYEGAVQQRPLAGLDGNLSLDIPSVGKLAAWLDQPLDPAQPDPGPLRVAATLKAAGAKMELTQAFIEGSAMKANANGSIDASGAIPEIVANLTVEELNLNAYLPPREEKAEAEAKAKAEEKPARKGWSEEPFDLAPLRSANAEIHVRTGKVLYRELVIDRSRISVTLRGGVLKANVEEMLLADGQVSAAVTLDGKGEVAAIDYQAQVTGVQALPVLMALADKDWLSGTTELTTRGKAQGRNQKEVVQTLNGDGRVKFTDGAIEGFNLAGTLRKAQTLGFDSSAGEREKTDFAELSASFTITNGVLENRDFKMLAPLVRVGGNGLVFLPPQTIDYNAEAKLVASLQGQGGENSLAGLPIGINIKGPWEDPSFNIDWASVFSQAALDPSRLSAMPDSLRKAAEGFGVALPGLGGAGGALGGLLKLIPGVGSRESPPPAPPQEPLTTTTTTTAPAPAPAQPTISAPPPTTSSETEGGFVGSLKEVLKKKGNEEPGEEPEALKALKGLFGG